MRQIFTTHSMTVLPHKMEIVLRPQLCDVTSPYVLCMCEITVKTYLPLVIMVRHRTGIMPLLYKCHSGRWRCLHVIKCPHNCIHILLDFCIIEFLLVVRHVNTWVISRSTNITHQRFCAKLPIVHSLTLELSLFSYSSAISPPRSGIFTDPLRLALLNILKKLLTDSKIINRKLTNSHLKATFNRRTWINNDLWTSEAVVPFLKF